MNGFSEKIFLSLNMPTEELPVSDSRRILLALETLGYENVSIPLPVLRRLYPMCRDSGFDITVTLVRRETDWVVTQREGGHLPGPWSWGSGWWAGAAAGKGHAVQEVLEGR